MSDCADLKAELAKLNSQIAGIGKRLGKLEDDVGKLKGNQGKVKQGGEPDLSGILSRLSTLEGDTRNIKKYISTLDGQLKAAAQKLGEFTLNLGQALGVINKILKPIITVFEFVNSWRLLK